MREILFRGKNKDNGKWVYGYYSPANIPIMGCIGHFINENGYKAVEVNPETVCQFTGLTDKNGVKIFEGDIVSTDLERPYLIVEFMDGCFMFKCNDGGEDYYDIMVPTLKEPQTVYKYGGVIGNIFDNPELMEEGVQE